MPRKSDNRAEREAQADRVLAREERRHPTTPPAKRRKTTPPKPLRQKVR